MMALRSQRSTGRSETLEKMEVNVGLFATFGTNDRTVSSRVQSSIVQSIKEICAHQKEADKSRGVLCKIIRDNNLSLKNIFESKVIRIVTFFSYSFACPELNLHRTKN
jgi:hypothetical protein